MSQQLGEIKITDEVISSIAGAAALRAEGVHSMSGTVVEDLTEILGKKNLSKGVNIILNDKGAIIDVNIIIKHGYKLHDVAIQVQENVKKDIQNLVGIKVDLVNVFIDGVKFLIENGNSSLKEEGEEKWQVFLKRWEETEKL